MHGMCHRLQVSNRGLVTGIHMYVGLVENTSYALAIRNTIVNCEWFVANCDESTDWKSLKNSLVDQNL